MPDIDIFGKIKAQTQSGIVCDWNAVESRPIIKADLTIITPTENIYYQHTGTTDTYTQGIIYLYNGTEFKPIDGSGSGGGGISQTVTLLASGWEDNSQTITVNGVTANNNVLISPSGNPSDYAEAGIYCSTQGNNTLTFVCEIEPTDDIVVNVLINV